MSSRHVVIAGDAAGELRAVSESLRLRGAIVTQLGHETGFDPTPVTTFIVATRFRAGSKWDAWWDHDARNEEAFRTVLPRLDSASNGLLVGLSDTTDRADRARIRAGIGSLLALFQSQAATERGIDFSMNAIELPPHYARDLLDRRLEEHARRRDVLANAAVIRFEDLTHQTIAQALTNDFV
jgi:hypothetical protein